MKRVKWSAAGLVGVALFWSGCAGSLPSSLRRQIADEHERLRDTEQEVQRLQRSVDHDLASEPELFRNAPDPAPWTARLTAGRNSLLTAEETDRELASIAGRNRPEQAAEANTLLTKERSLRRSATEDSRAAGEKADKWLNFKRDLASNLDRMKRDYDGVRQADLAPVTKTVQDAERDWPAKRDALNDRLEAVRGIQKSAEADWSSTAALCEQATSGSIGGAALATLIEASERLSDEVGAIGPKSDELRGLAGQLYDSWDKVLIDLESPEKSGEDQYRERIKTVRTHITDFDSKQTETSSSEQWLAVPGSAFHSVENDLGMAIAHKDAGLFDTEAFSTPQPAGFAYIAPETQGSNQYGYWTHDRGTSVWTWLPQYLILRELLWNHSYRPVVIDEYRGYRTAQSAGRTYYGQTTATAAPKYGTHGTFTRTSYASSRYVQSGGFKASAYASHGRSSAPSIFGSPRAEGSAGHRFGTGANPASGRRFGQSGIGRSFGRRR